MMSRPLFNAYRVLSIVVGVLLLVGALSLLPKYLAEDGSGLQEFGAGFWWVFVLHGYAYMAYVVIAFVLARKAGFGVGRMLLLFVAGLIPLLMFFVEARTVRDLKATHPELA